MEALEYCLSNLSSCLFNDALIWFLDQALMMLSFPFPCQLQHVWILAESLLSVLFVCGV